MTNNHDADSRRSRYRWRYGPLRLALPWIAIVVGAILVVTHRDPVVLALGIGLIVVGIIAFFVYRFMAKRGI
jgi:Ca2+/Na+ antiporter